MRRVLKIVGALLLVALAYLFFWPVPIDPVAWQAPAFAGYAGPHAQNDRLATARPISVAPYVGPEHIEFGPDGKLYTGVLGGKVLRMNTDGSGIETFVDTGGRPLGLDFAPDGRMVIADALRGLLRVETDGRVVVLADKVGDEPILYADALIVARDGRIFLTDASQKTSPREFGTFDASAFDIMEHSCSGRVLVHDPAAGSTHTLIGGLCFPNGVVLSGDEFHLFIAETGEYRIWKVDVRADGLDARAILAAGSHPQARVIADNLPGFPDNLTRDADGRLWTGFTKPRSAALDGMAQRPWLRSLSLRLPRQWWPVPPTYGHVVAFDEDGRVVADLQDPNGGIPETSGATVHGGMLYVQSLHASALGVMEAPRATP